MFDAANGNKVSSFIFLRNRARLRVRADRNQRLAIFREIAPGFRELLKKEMRRSRGNNRKENDGMG